MRWLFPVVEGTAIENDEADTTNSAEDILQVSSVCYYEIRLQVYNNFIHRLERATNIKEGCKYRY